MTADKAATEHEKTGEKAVDSGHKQVEAAEKSTLSHREEREALRGVGETLGAQIPMLGLWLNQATAGLAGVLAGAELLKQGLEVMNEPLAQANALLLAIDASRLQSAAQAASAMATALGDIQDKESDMQASFARGTTALENRLKLYDAQKDAVVKVAEAQERAFEAELDHQTALNPLLKEQNDAAKERARLQLDLLRGSSDAAKLQNEIHERSLAQAQAQFNIDFGVDKNAVTGAMGKAGGTKSDADAAKAALEQYQKSGVLGLGKLGGSISLEDAMQKLLEHQQALKQEQGGLNDPNVTGFEEREIQRIRERIELYNKGLNNTRLSKA